MDRCLGWVLRALGAETLNRFASQAHSIQLKSVYLSVDPRRADFVGLHVDLFVISGEPLVWGLNPLENMVFGFSS